MTAVPSARHSAPHPASPGAAPGPAAGQAAAAPTTGFLAGALKAQLVGRADLLITSVDAIDKARPGALTFIRDGKFAHRWAASRASAALVTRGLEVAGHDPAARALIFVDDADMAVIKLLEMFAPPPASRPAGVHPSAIVHPAAKIAASAFVGPGCIISEGAAVGERTALHAQVYLGPASRIGSDCTIHPNVTILDRCTIGDRCILWPGVRIGSDGFGYRSVAPPASAGEGAVRTLVKIPHIGSVAVGNDVEIGANSCIDRGKFGPTIIGEGSKIDNICQIAHNVVVGRSVIICGVAGIAGSVTLEDEVTLAGHVGVADNITIGKKSIISAKSGVVTDVPANQTWFGTPAGPHKDQMRAFAALRQLSTHLRMLKRLDRAAHENQKKQGGGADFPAPGH